MYVDTEVYPIPIPGGRYWNVTSQTLRCWNSSSTSWVTCSSGGGSGPIIELNSTSISPSSPANFFNTASVTWTFSGGHILATAVGSGCGSITGDNTSTDCGDGNLVGDSTSPPANTSTFGYQNLNYSAIIHGVAIGSYALGGDATHLLTGSDVTAIGDEPLANCSAVGTRSLVEVVGIGDAAGLCSNGSDMVFVGDSVGIYVYGSQDIVGVGDTSGENIATGSDNIVGVGNTSASQGGAGSSDIVGVGDTSATDTGVGSTAIVGVGEASATHLVSGSSDVTAVGDAALNQHLRGAAPLTDAVGIGDSAGSVASGSELIFIGTLAGGCSNADEVTAIGNFSLGGGFGGTNCSNGNTGTEIISIGDHALAANQSGTDNIAIGKYAGSNGYIINVTNGNANLTGSHNVWIGNNSGPATSTQLSNTTAIGDSAIPDASNQTVIGDSSKVSLKIYGCPTGQIVLDDGSGTCHTVTSYFNTPHDVTSLRAWSTVYQNLTGTPMSIAGDGTGVTGGSTAAISCVVGITSSPTITAYHNSWGATIEASSEGFNLIVPNNYYYECVTAGDVSPTPANWIETY
jgi:hypothetical protein